ncbi:MAG TPA: hypothetical protein PLW77_00835 [Bacteroidales bacterium]|nr:hypothetical protein [Bacteroidales bacterium]HQB21299.1 hypothetical protein [Bacteroidales bacterium]
MKKNILLFLIFVYTTAFAQSEKEVENKASTWTMVGNVQYVTQHHWRGLGRGPLFGEAPAFEPSIMFFNKNWNVGVFTAGSFDGVYKAILPWISFSPVKNLWIGVWDIYSPGWKLWTSEAKPFDFGLNTSNHFVDAVVSYQLPWIPLSFKWATIVTGKDPNAEGKRNFTTYAELSYAHAWKDFSIWGGVGVTPWGGLYHRAKGGINNLELKFQYNFRIYKPVTIPVFAKFAYSPLAEQFHFVAGASIKIPYSFK